MLEFSDEMLEIEDEKVEETATEKCDDVAKAVPDLEIVDALPKPAEISNSFTINRSGVDEQEIAPLVALPAPAWAYDPGLWSTLGLSAGPDAA